MSNIRIFLIVICVIIIVFFIVKGLEIKRENKQFKIDKKQLVKEKYPELSEADLKYRQSSLEAYQRIHMHNPKKGVILLAILGFIIGIIGAVSGAIYALITSGSLFIPILLLAVSYYSLSLVVICNPTIDQQFDFWYHYLEKNPDNQLQVVLTPREMAEKIVENQKKFGLYCSVIGVMFTLISILSY